MSEPTANGPARVVLPPVGVVDLWEVQDRHCLPSGWRVVMTRAAWEGMDRATRPDAYPGHSGELVMVEVRGMVVFPADPRRAIFRGAVEAHRDAVAARDRAAEAPGGAAGLDTWTALACSAVVDAERHLIRAILAWGPGVRDSDLRDAARRWWPAQGVRYGGRTYLAVPDQDAGPGESVREGTMIRLVVVEAGAIGLVG